MSHSLRRASRAAAVVRLATTVLVLVFAATCVRDQTTAPALRTPPSVATHSTYTTLGTYSIPIPGDNLNGAGVPAANTGIFVPAGTYYRIRVNGTVTTTLNPAYVALGGTAGFASWTGTWGPGGTGNWAELQVLLKYRITSSGAVGPIPFLNLQMGASAPDSARTDVQYTSTQIEIQAGRNGIACAIGSSQGEAGCYLLTASQTVTVEQVTDVAHVVANPVAVHPNTQVIFTASRDDGGNLIVYNWHWQPDAGQPGNATNLCGGGNPCQMNVVGSGTMLVYTNVGNPTAHVTVYQATNPDTSFRLVADRSTAKPGDTVTFTPLYNNVPGPAARWRWVALDTSKHDNSACGQGVSPCRKGMLASGTMWAYTSTVLGQGDSASADVLVADTTGDCIMRVRRRVAADGRWFGVNSAGGICAPPLGADTQLVVHCTFNNGQTRGDSAQCKASMQPEMPFTMRMQSATRWHVYRMSQYSPYTVDSLSESIDVPIHVQVAAGSNYVWEGPIVAYTKITFFADISRADGSVVTLAQSDVAAPVARAWTQWFWDNSRSVTHDDKLLISSPTFTPAPDKNFQVIPSGTHFLSGMFVPQLSDSATIGATVVAIGPDSGVIYVKNDAPAQTFYLFVHPALREPLTLSTSDPNFSTVQSWQQRQTGGTISGGGVYCDSAGVDSIYRFAWRHEGGTHASNSHWGIGDSVFTHYPIHQVVEALTLPPSMGTWYDVQNWLFTFFYGSGTIAHGPYLDPETGFDSPNGPEYTGISSICTFRP